MYSTDQTQLTESKSQINPGITFGVLLLVYPEFTRVYPQYTQRKPKVNPEMTQRINFG